MSRLAPRNRLSSSRSSFSSSISSATRGLSMDLDLDENARVYPRCQFLRHPGRRASGDPDKIRLERLHDRRLARRAKSMDGLCNLLSESTEKQIPDTVPRTPVMTIWLSLRVGG